MIRMMMMIIYGRDIDDDEEVDSRDGMVMMAEIEIVTEGGVHSQKLYP